MNSLERQLQIGLSASVVALMALLGWLMITVAQQLTEEFALTRLKHDGDSLLAAMSIDASGHLSINSDKISAIYRQPLSGHYYQIQLAVNETLTSRSLWDTQLTTPQLSPGQSKNWKSRGPSDQQLLLWAGGYNKQGKTLTLTVAEDITALQQSLYRYTWGFAAVAILVLIVLLLLQKHIVRRSLKPLRRLSHELDELERGEIKQLTDEVPYEIRPLVIEVNRLLELMHQRLQRSRSALGNLAHALKGPLNLLTQLADSEEVKASDNLHRELLQQTEQLRQLIDHELKRARLAGVGGAAQRFVPAEEIPTLIELLQRIYSDKSLSFETDYPEGVLSHFDRNDLLELTGNLLDNACKFSNGKVALQIRENSGLEITVEDNGPGVSEEELGILLKRGSRLDESQPGHGLGLAIVKEITEIYHGELVMTLSRALGGLRVKVKLYPSQA